MKKQGRRDVDLFFLCVKASDTDSRALHIARAYEKYQTQLKENNALDFDDIIYVTVHLLQENEDVRRYYQRKFRYVMVDEYQDPRSFRLPAYPSEGGYRSVSIFSAFFLSFDGV